MPFVFIMEISADFMHISVPLSGAALAGSECRHTVVPIVKVYQVINRGRTPNVLLQQGSELLLLND
jgi:hypothetical protein